MPNDPPNQYERAYRAWPILTATAARKGTITYAELAARLGIHPRPIRYVLGVIQDRCLDEKWPPLTILVVNQQHHLPGTGFIAWDIDKLEDGYRRVYTEPWDERPNPFAFARDGATPDQLAERLVARPDEAAAVYGRIQNRGVAQDVFRRALLKAYRHRCAFCRLSLQPALQAAHIIPWTQASPAERVSPTNGLLLCSTHHALFDADVLTVTADRTVEWRREKLPGHRWSEPDRLAAVALDGQPIALPSDHRLWPSPTSLAHRASRLAG